MKELIIAILILNPMPIPNPAEPIKLPECKTGAECDDKSAFSIIPPQFLPIFGQPPFVAEVEPA